jgi:hypothetical protein
MLKSYVIKCVGMFVEVNGDGRRRHTRSDVEVIPDAQLALLDGIYAPSNSWFSFVAFTAHSSLHPCRGAAVCIEPLIYLRDVVNLAAAHTWNHMIPCSGVSWTHWCFPFALLWQR